MEVDWEALRAAAREAQTHAYAPYSHYLVGAAAVTEDGRVFTGCNTENATYGGGLCAEGGLVSALTLGGGGRLRAFVCYGNPAADLQGAGVPTVTVPCGRCRQLLREHAGADFEIEMPTGVRPFAEILPDSFGPEFL